MSQLDFIGGIPPEQRPQFRDIRNTRESTAETKAGLVWDLGQLCKKVPPSIASGSVQRTHEWMAAQKVALALAKNSRATVPQLTAAISNMRRFI